MFNSTFQKDLFVVLWIFIVSVVLGKINKFTDVVSDIKFNWRSDEVLETNLRFQPNTSTLNITFYLIFQGNNSNVKTNFTTIPAQTYSHNVTVNTKFNPTNWVLYFKMKNKSYYTKGVLKPRYLSYFAAVGITDKTKLFGCKQSTCDAVNNVPLYQFNEKIADFSYGNDHNELYLITNGVNKLMKFSIINGTQIIWRYHTSLSIRKLCYDWLNKVIYMTDFNKIYKLQSAKLNVIYKSPNTSIIKDLLVDPIGGYIHVVNMNKELFEYNTLFLETGGATNVPLLSAISPYFIRRPFALSMTKEFGVVLINATHLTGCNWYSDNCTSVSSVTPAISKELVKQKQRDLRFYQYEHGFLVFIMEQEQYFHLELNKERKYHKNSSPCIQLSAYNNRMSSPRRTPGAPLTPKFTSIYIAADKAMITFNQPEPNSLSQYAWRNWTYKFTVYRFLNLQPYKLNQTRTTDKSVILGGLKPRLFCDLKIESGTVLQTVFAVSGLYNLSIKMRILTMNPTMNLVQIWLYSFQDKTIRKVKNYKLNISGFNSLHEMKDGSLIGLRHGVLLLKGSFDSYFKELDRQIIKYEIEPNSESIYWLNTKGEVYRIQKFCQPYNTKRLIIKGPINNFLLVGIRLIIMELQSGNKIIKCCDLNGHTLRDGRGWCYQKEPNHNVICKNTNLFLFSMHPRNITFVKNFNKIEDPEDFRCLITGFGFLNTLPDKKKVTLYSFNYEAGLDIQLSTKNITFLSVLELGYENDKCKSITDSQWKTLKDVKLDLNLYSPNLLILSWNSPFSNFTNATDLVWHIKINKLTYKRKNANTNIDLTSKFNCAEKVHIRMDLNSKYSTLYSVTENKVIPCFAKSSKLQNIFLVTRPTDKTGILHLETSLDPPVDNKITKTKNLNCFLLVQLMDGSGLRILMRLKIISVNCTARRLQKIVEIRESVLLEEVDKSLLCMYYVITKERTIEYLNVIQLPYLKTCMPAQLLKSTKQKISLNANQNFVFYQSKNQPIKTIQINSNNQLELKMVNNSHIIRYETLAFTNKKCFNTSMKSCKLEVDWLKNRLFIHDSCKQELIDVDLTNGISRNWYQKGLVKSNLNVLERKLTVKIKTDERIFDISQSETGWRLDLKALKYCNTVRINQQHQECLGNSNNINGYYMNDPLANRNTAVILKDWYTSSERRCMVVKLSGNYKIDNIKQCSLISKIPEIIMELKPGVWFHKSGSIVRQTRLVEAVDPITNLLHGIDLWCDRKCIFVKSESRKLQQITYTQENNQSTTIYPIPNQKLYVIRNLNPATEFKFQIQIDRNNITLSAQCNTSVDVPDPIKQINIMKMSQSNFEVKWDTPEKDNGSPIVKYEIQIDLQHDKYQQILTNYSNSTKIQFNLDEFNISRPLNAVNSKFVVKIAPHNLIGQGPWKSKIVQQIFNSTNTMSLLTIKNINKGSIIAMVTIVLIILIILFIIAILIIYTKLNLQQSVVTSKLLIPKLQKSSNNEHVLELNCLYNITEGNSEFNVVLSDFDKIPHYLCEKIRFIQLIGKGAFGSVFKGTLTVSVHQNDERIGDIQEDVALKMRNEESVSETEFKREAVLMWRYSHPYIVRLLGVTFDRPDRQSLILEYMERGNLRDYLRRKRRLANNTSNNNSNVMTDSKSSRGSCSSATLNNNNAFGNGIQYLDTAFDVLKALVYLEENRFVHRDIAARNCLVSHRISLNRGERITKLGDFGLSRDTYDQGYYRHIPTHSKAGDDNNGTNDYTKKTSNKVVGVPVKWMAPETLKDNVYSGASDVWAWAVLCWEVLSMGAEPYSGRGNREVVGAVIDGETPGKASCGDSSSDGGLRQSMEAIMNRCWRYYPEDRPTFKEIENDIFHINKADLSNFPPPAEEEPEPIVPMPSEYTDIVFRSGNLQIQQQLNPLTTTFTNAGVLRSQVSSYSNDTITNGSAYMNSNYENDGYERPLLNLPQ